MSQANLEFPESVAPAARTPYRGRFAPSPTGPLHIGSLVTALASWLDARAHGGTWLVRIEDIDFQRNVPGADRDILASLETLGLVSDEAPQWQSAHLHRFEAALAQLQAIDRLYPCGCTRREIADSVTTVDAQGRPRHQTLIYPGTCRNGLMGRPARAWRVRLPDADAATVCFDDRWQGTQQQNLAEAVGDFVLKRADGMWAYQIAVVVDDAEQGITDVVRGADLLDSTPRQIYLQRLLGLPVVRYLHVPVVVNADGEKLSKQTGARAINRSQPLAALTEAARHLGLEIRADDLEGFYRAAVPAWANRLARLTPAT
ncbi:tRNA glutamyl-Q(34) synthetase GluQRS [Ralstonia solanacearum]|uniref:Glutamyl-Q tRNA(Asp) synthetase n=1 Tax=Ralstonia solanacearum K60 TaxID=1091042 RepID=A0AAP7ZQF3_RALSL|nr:tRNA glutamyl-Q(34) synthetase GluQRS [Ralstonia solanacearum]MBT1538685.1 tRNA glutamyl-Q(34) synthetase GluQRS [Ralstonia solanacearum]OYQ14431.1 tRNA glutamyl-Q(34) synthetase GluQRS [Ralstonia solanacearum K60]QOK81802.1 tRNA glutamyl-Q(34) synthetase GluQRS [Ralstonia solanacearum]RIJ85866.1 tRNA glutamyl-Q(34) synthetase GluQRS [Ralstonia solanacearum]CCF98855.1 Glutamate--tRNA ligase [Ralstonia solanacearum K60]